VVTLQPADGRWSFDPAELRAALTPRTRLILLNSPHNPTGTVFTESELAVVAELAREHDLVVITDEVYEHLIFDGVHLPLASLPGMAERTVTISSAGKTFSVTGWKVGWVCAPAELLARVRAVKQFLTFVGSGPFQYAVAEGLQAGADYYAGIAAGLQARRDVLVDGLAGLGYQVLRPQATYFATVDLGGGAEAWCRALPERAGVVAIPSRVFYDSAIDRYVRFAFCKRFEVLEEAISRLARLPEAGSGRMAG
jgi:N-succinyldiaminopimelate aminotransferase